MFLIITKHKNFFVFFLVILVSFMCQIKYVYTSDAQKKSGVIEIAVPTFTPVLPNYCQEANDPLCGIKKLETTLSKDAGECSQQSHNEMKKCVRDILPLLKPIKIPSTRYETETICKWFNKAIDCMANWMDRCQNKDALKSFNATVSPVKEMYSSICKDKFSRAKFYRNGPCYTKISEDFESFCVKRLGIKLIGLDDLNEAKEICCHQRNFLRCISNVLHYHQCPQEARDKFLEFVEYTLGFRPEQIQMTLAEKKINCLIMSEQHCNDLMVPGWESYGSNFVRGKASDHKKLSFNLLIIFGSIGSLLY